MLVYLDSQENLDVMVYLDYLVWRVVKVTEDSMVYQEQQVSQDCQVSNPFVEQNVRFKYLYGHLNFVKKEEQGICKWNAAKKISKNQDI